jgi:predicted O-methyltransferase YrrM
MGRETLNLDGPLLPYFLAHAFREPPILARLRAETATMTEAGMQIAPEQGALMRLLVQLAQARQCIEVGTFTGYSALVTALALPEGGRLVCCDVSETYTAVARRYWAEAGVAHRIELRLGPARDTLDDLLEAGRAGTIDQVFLDADKANYGAYYDRALKLLRPGGLLLVDNTLWSGRVAEPSDASADTQAIRALNARIQADARVEHCLVPIGDGLTLARKV